MVKSFKYSAFFFFIILNYEFAFFIIIILNFEFVDHDTIFPTWFSNVKIQ